MKEWLTIALLLTGGAFSLLAAIGIVRLPDLFIRLHAAAKGGTMAASLLIIASAVHFWELGVTTGALLVVLFLFLTAPIASHLIARAAYLVGVPLWQDTIEDELKGRYNLDEQVLESPPMTPSQKEIGKNA